MKGIEDCLLYIQSKLIAKKNLTNKFGGYQYRSFESILEALKPLLKETGCVFIASDRMVAEGNRYYIEAKVTLRKGEQEISATGYAREPEIQKGMNDAQVTGSASSYARKYATNGLFAIDDNKDADHFDNSQEHKITEEMIARFDKLLSHKCFDGKKKDIKKNWAELFLGDNPKVAGASALAKMEVSIKEFEEAN